MLGVKETRSTESPKTYNCVACSATFHSLSSLLVHQPSHAMEVSRRPDSTLPACAHCGSLFTTKDLLEKHDCVMSPVSAQTFVSDGGEDISDMTALEEHKKQHTQEIIHESDFDRGTEDDMPTCVSCGKVFDNNDHLEKHQCITFPTPASSSHTYVCDSGEDISDSTAVDDPKSVCSQDTGKSDSNGTPDMENTCVSCGNVFASKDLLENHWCVKQPTIGSPGLLHTSDFGEDISDSNAFEDPKSDCSQEDADKSDSNGTSDTEDMRMPRCVSCGNVFASKDLLDTHQCVILPTAASPGHPYICDSGEESALKSGPVPPVSIQIFHCFSQSLVNKNPFSQSTSSSSKMTASTSDLESNNTKPSESQSATEDQEQNHEDSASFLNHSEDEHEKSPAACKESNEENQGSEGKDESSQNLLASANTRHTPIQTKLRNLPPRKVSPRAPFSPLNTMMTPRSESTSNSLKPGNVLKKAKIISVTQTLCPVVALETRQKLIGRDNVEGKHQCRLCRRVFQDVDSLIMHHALHRKERVKFCLCCQQFVISLISVPDNHACFNASSKTSQPLSLKPVTPSAQPAEKMFYCALCKRGYAQLRYLRRHRCPCRPRPKPSSKVGNHVNAKLHNTEGHEMNREYLMNRVNIAVGTDRVKMEEHNTDFPIGKKNLTNPPDTPEPSPKMVNSVQHRLDMFAMQVHEGGKQWTMPLDEAEVDILVDTDVEDLADGPEDEPVEDGVVLDSSEYMEINVDTPGKGFQVHITNKGVRRYVCNECQKSYSRRFTLFEHLKVCEAIKLKEQNVENSLMDIQGPIKRFPCPRCGKFFSRKDNMKMHHKRCHLINANSALSPKSVDPKPPKSQQNLFVLSPSTEKQPVQQESAQNTSSSRNWGIMSLPTVLPRRVTCECGASFTCPRLLFEHLQQHAEESYICPHCGESLQSWMDFETHQQMHKESQSANTPRSSQKQPGPFTQVAPRQAPLPQTSGFSDLEARPQTFFPPKHVNDSPLPEPLSCPRCKKTFSFHSSLLKHLQICSAGNTVSQKKYPCTRCGATFLNPLKLKVHLQNNTCKPAFKPIQCPVCVRWFSCLDGLKKHLISHSKQVVCQICDKNFPTAEALEEHKRSSHALNSGMRPAENTPERPSQAAPQTRPPTPFQCHICHRYYPKLQSLKDHLRKVHRPKNPNIKLPIPGPLLPCPFPCQICGRSYPTIKALKNHRRRVHHILGAVFPPSRGAEQIGAPRQYQCHICPNNFADMQSLLIHKRRAHGTVEALQVFKGIVNHIYKCHICHRSYPDELSIKNHRRRVHRILGPVPEASRLPLTSATNDTVDEIEEKPIPFL